MMPFNEAKKVDGYGFASSILQPTAPPAYNQIYLSSEQKLQEIANKYEIGSFFLNKLKELSKFKTVFLFDDSGSMSSIVKDSPLNNGSFMPKRWDELTYFANISIEIANLFNSNGTDVYFLNRPGIKNVQSFEQLKPYFEQPPRGYTPLTRAVREILKENSGMALNEKKLLILIVTDGEPTTDSGTVDIKSFKRVLQERNNSVYTTIVTCTDEQSSVDYLNKLDRQLPRLDVVDDYRNEKLEIQSARGRQFPFSFGDYVVKCLLGSIDPQLDKSDEKGNCLVQ